MRLSIGYCQQLRVWTAARLVWSTAARLDGCEAGLVNSCEAGRLRGWSGQQLRGWTAARLVWSTAARLDGCEAGLVNSCEAGRLRGWSGQQLRGWTAARLVWSTAARLDGCEAGRLRGLNKIKLNTILTKPNGWYTCAHYLSARKSPSPILRESKPVKLKIENPRNQNTEKLRTPKTDFRPQPNEPRQLLPDSLKTGHLYNLRFFES